MYAVRRMRSLSGGERRLMMLAVLLLLLIRLALWLVPYRMLTIVRRRLRGPLSRLPWRLTAGPAEIGAAVRRAGRLVPRSSCLPQALAAELLLAIAGHAPQLRLGVARGPGGETLAHAWVEAAGRVVIGGPVHDFIPLSVAPPGSR